jgi:ABC-type glutathione transport system ATPase component
MSATAEPSTTLLSVRGLCVEYTAKGSTVVAVHELDMTVSRSEIVGIVGGSGSGKSSIALALLGLALSPGRITGGSVEFEGTDLIHGDDAKVRLLRGKRIGLVMQNPRAALNPMMTVGKQISAVLKAHDVSDRAGRKARAVEMLRRVGINDPLRRYDAYPHELSGGMAQRALIAMALCCGPDLVVADDPTSGLDVTVQGQILDDLARNVRDLGTAAVIVTQDLGVIANYCDRVLVVDAGAAVEEGDPSDVLRRPQSPETKALVEAASSILIERV